MLQEPITTSHNFKAKLDPWFLLVQHLNQSLTQVRSRLSNQTSTSTINLLPTVEVVWRQLEMQAHSLNQSVQSLEQEVVSSLNKTTRPIVTAAVSSVGGIFVCLLLLLSVFVGGFLQITVKERCLQKPSKSLVSLPFHYFREIQERHIRLPFKRNLSMCFPRHHCCPTSSPSNLHDLRELPSLHRGLCLPPRGQISIHI